MRLAVAAVIAVALLAAGAAAAVLAFAPGVGAQGLDSPVSYQVGDVLVFGSAARNGSCSITRNIANTGDQPLRVIGSATWPGQPVHLPPNQGGFDGDVVLAPGEQATAAWTNTGYVTDGAVDLTWTVLVPDGVAQIGANHLEPVPACTPAAPPSTTAPETTVPDPVTDPTSVTVTPAPDTTTPPPSVVSGPAPSTTTTVEPAAVVLTSTARRLPETGSSTAALVVLGAGLLVSGGSVLAGRDRLTSGENAS